MKHLNCYSNALNILVVWLLMALSSTTVFADEDWDPELNIQVPHQPILNNERLPGSTGNMGAMTYSIPIKVAPGRGGLQPQLALTYNSSSRKNSWVGVGWSLDLGSIERSKKQRVNFGDSDAFVFNGSMELVARPDWGDGYYGARIEEQFVKFQFLGDSNGWQVRFPDGRIHHYGTAANSQLQTAQGVFRWLLDEIEDANGNPITVTYDKQAGDEIYPQRISYNPGSYVQFYMESRTDVYPVYSSHTRVEASRRLDQIRCYGYGGSQAHRYVFNYDYSDHSQRSLLTSVQEYGSGGTALRSISFDYEAGTTFDFDSRRSRSTDYGNHQGSTHFADINGDGFMDLVLFHLPTERVDVFLWDNDRNNFSNGIQNDMEWPTTASFIHLGDVNGDGKFDIVIKRATQSTSIRVYHGEAGGSIAWNGEVYYLQPHSQDGILQLADVNGDGLADLISFPLASTYVDIYLADGSGGFDEDPIECPLNNSDANERGRVFIADANGDGLADIVKTPFSSGGGSAIVHLCDNSNNTVTFNSGVSTSLDFNTEPGRVHFADINGDGLSDLVLSPFSPGGDGGLWAYYANGNGGFEFAATTYTNSSNYPGYVHFADVNGDGFADLIKSDQHGFTVSIYLGDRTGQFYHERDINSGNNGFASVLDVNCDGLADLLKFPTHDTTVYVYLAEGLSPADTHPDLLNFIDSDHGVTSTISYSPSTDFSSVYRPSGSYPNAYLPFRMDLVTSIVVDDSIDHTVTTTYAYQGAHYHIGEKELLGMGEIARHNPNGTTLTTDYAVNDYYLKGRPITARYEDDGSSNFIQTDYDWDQFTIENGAIWVRLNEKSTEMRSAATVSLNEDYTYRYETRPDFGYLYETVRSGSGTSDGVTTVTNYGRYGGSSEWIWRLDDERIRQGTTTARFVEYQYDSNGNLTRETHQNNDGSDAEIVRTYDRYGNIRTERDANDNTTTYSYTNNTFVSSKNFEGLTTTYSSYNQWGRPRSMRDPNGGTTSYSYDDYGRLTRENYPGPGDKTIDYTDNAPQRYTETTIEDGTTTRQYIDGLDRPLQTTISSAGSDEITTRIYYDNAGRVTKTLGPFFTSGFGYYTGSGPSTAPYQERTDFDFLNRPLTIVRAHDSGTAATDISYSGFNRTITDPEGKATTEQRDFMGRIRAIVDADNHTTDYDYNGAGDLTAVQDTDGNTTQLQRNWLGHLTRLIDPDLGTWDFTYFPNGEVRTRQDSQVPRQSITYGYDDRNRLTSKVYADETPDEPDVTYTYDDAVNGNGRLYSVTKGNVTTTYNAYDDMGRLTEKTITIDSQNYPFSYTYDAAGNQTSITYPDGYVVNYDYHNDSNLIDNVSAANPDLNADIDHYSNFGKPGRITLPALTASIDYYSRTGRVEQITVPGLMALDYTYDRVGNVTDIRDTRRNLEISYSYDDLHRLTHETFIGPFISPPADRDIDLYYETTEPHAVSRVVADGDERSLIYEDNGNLTIGYDFSRPGQIAERQIEYNAENMPVSLGYIPEGGSLVTTTFTYDGDGRRVKKQTGGDTVIYVDDTYEIRNGQPIKYIFAGSLRIAKVTGTNVQYYHKDHLGSAALVTDASGNLLDSTAYEPFGQQRGIYGPKLGDVAYTFTDQEWDAESGLYNYDARLYDAVLGRFISADSVVPDWYDPQALDRYAYALNNPLAFIDPTGHDAESTFDRWVASTPLTRVGEPYRKSASREYGVRGLVYTRNFLTYLHRLEGRGINVDSLTLKQLDKIYREERAYRREANGVMLSSVFLSGIVREGNIRSNASKSPVKNYTHTKVGGKSAITDGNYTTDPIGMARHKPGTAPNNKSVFKSGVDAEQATLDAARYADKNNLWNAQNKAKVPVNNGDVGYLSDGTPTQTINVYRRKSGGGYLIHGTPGSN